MSIETLYHPGSFFKLLKLIVVVSLHKYVLSRGSSQSVCTTRSVVLALYLFLPFEVICFMKYLPLFHLHFV